MAVDIHHHPMDLEQVESCLIFLQKSDDLAQQTSRHHPEGTMKVGQMGSEEMGQGPAFRLQEDCEGVSSQAGGKGKDLFLEEALAEDWKIRVDGCRKMNWAQWIRCIPPFVNQGSTL